MKTFAAISTLAALVGTAATLTRAAPKPPAAQAVTQLLQAQAIPAGSHSVTFAGGLGCFSGTTPLVPTWTPGKFLGYISSCDGEIVYHLDARTGQSTLDVIEGATLLAYYSGSGGNLQLVKSNGGGWPGGITVQ